MRAAAEIALWRYIASVAIETDAFCVTPIR
jgi:hypothetical protein